MKRNNIIATLAILMIVAGGVVGFLLYIKPNDDISKSKTDFELSAFELITEFESETSIASEKYIGKVLVVKGTVQAISVAENSVHILLADPDQFFGINCSLADKYFDTASSISESDYIIIKGECKGYMYDVILSNCKVLKRNE